MSYMDFSSWPREQEQSFVVYEQHASQSQKTAFVTGIIAAVAVLVIALGIYTGVEPDKRDLSNGMNMQNLSKKSVKAEPKAEPKAEAPAPAPSAAPAAAPAADPAGSAASAPASDDKK